MSEQLIKKYKIRAKKSLGQNFLVNENIVDIISKVCEVEGQNIIEVWPWYWVLTEKLLDQIPRALTLVELDLDMIKILEERVESKQLQTQWVEFQIQNKDVLKFAPDFEKYLVIANIPYYITSPILRHFLYSLEHAPENMVILLQKDVWDKILLWEAWGDKMRTSVLSLIVAKKAYVREVIVVSSDNFIPAPKVESSVLLFTTRTKYDEYSDEKFLKLIKIAFMASRKKLSKNLINWWFEKSDVTRAFGRLNIDPMSRPENLGVDIWCKLSEELL